MRGNPVTLVALTGLNPLVHDIVQHNIADEHGNAFLRGHVNILPPAGTLFLHQSSQHGRGCSGRAPEKGVKSLIDLSL